jgi:hypothetical protein
MVKLAGPVGSKPAPTLCAQRAGASTPSGRSRRLHAQANGPGIAWPDSLPHNRERSEAAPRGWAAPTPPNRLGRERAARNRKSPQPSGERWGKVWKGNSTHAPHRGAACSFLAYASPALIWINRPFVEAISRPQRRSHSALAGSGPPSPCSGDVRRLRGRSRRDPHRLRAERRVGGRGRAD